VSGDDCSLSFNSGYVAMYTLCLYNSVGIVQSGSTVFGHDDLLIQVLMDGLVIFSLFFSLLL
jgi:hypothetical protein